jgi:hypothetical protein
MDTGCSILVAGCWFQIKKLIADSSWFIVKETDDKGLKVGGWEVKKNSAIRACNTFILLPIYYEL